MRSYKAARRSAQRAEAALDPVPFEITYEDDDGVEHTESFGAVGEASAATLTDLGYFADLDADSPEAAAVVRRIFMELIGDAVEFRRFWKVAPFLDSDTMIDILRGLIEDTTGRPTKRPSDSPASSSTTGQASRVVSLQGGFLTARPPLEVVPLESSG